MNNQTGMFICEECGAEVDEQNAFTLDDGTMLCDTCSTTCTHCEQLMYECDTMSAYIGNIFFDGLCPECAEEARAIETEVRDSFEEAIQEAIIEKWEDGYR